MHSVHVLDGGPDRIMRRRNFIIFMGKEMPGHMRDDIAVSYAKSLNRSRCRLGCGWVGPTKYASCRVHTGATWRILL